MERGGVGEVWYKLRSEVKWGLNEHVVLHGHGTYDCHVPTSYTLMVPEVGRDATALTPSEDCVRGYH